MKSEIFEKPPDPKELNMEPFIEPKPNESEILPKHNDDEMFKKPLVPKMKNIQKEIEPKRKDEIIYNTPMCPQLKLKNKRKRIEPQRHVVRVEKEGDGYVFSANLSCK